MRSTQSGTPAAGSVKILDAFGDCRASRDRSAIEYLAAGETFSLDRCCHSSNGTGPTGSCFEKPLGEMPERLFLLTREGDMPNDKPLKPDDFPVEVEGEQLVTAYGKPIAKAKTPAIAEDIADRLNEDDYRKEQDRWSA